MYYVYILKSQKNQRRYTGSTDNLSKRLSEHNAGKSGYDKLNKPFALLHSENFQTRSEVVSRERYLKTGRGSDELKSMGL